jgi:phosphate transport system substrate-binding protein
MVAGCAVVICRRPGSHGRQNPTAPHGAHPRFCRICFYRASPRRAIHEKQPVQRGGGTSRGYLTLLDNTADLAIVSGAASEDTMDEIARRGVKLVNIPFRRVAMAPTVHFTNPVSDLSSLQLRDIFSGRINNWKLVGGKDAPINVYIGPPGDGITNTWNDKVLGDADTFTPRARNAELEQRIAGVAGDPSGITYLATDSLRDRALKVLSVDKVLAGADSVRSGRYTLLAPLMFVSREKPSPETQKFLQYVGSQAAPISNTVFALPEPSVSTAITTTTANR